MKKSALLLLLLFLLNACVKEITETIDKVSNTSGIQWNPTIAVPLVYSTLKLEDLLDEVSDLEYLRIEQDGSLTLIYADEYESKPAEEVVTLSNQAYGETFTLTAAQLNTLNTAGSVTLTINRVLGYNFGSYQLDKLWYKAGSFGLNISSTLEHDIVFKVSFPDAVQNGNVLSNTVQATYTTLPNTASNSLNLSDAEVDFTKTAQGHTEMNVSMEITITKKNSNTIKPTETITYSASLTDQKYKQLTGLFDIADFSSGGDSLNIGFFENNSGGSFTLADPRVKFIFTNSIGIPVDAKILEFTGTNSDNNSVTLTGVPSPLPVPSLDASQIGQTLKDSFELNKNTSNLASYINNRPAKNYYKLEVKTGPVGASRHWLVDTSRLKARVEIEIPLEGTAKNYALENSQPFDLQLDNVTEIKEVLIRLYTENGFPVDIATQIYFENSVTNTVIDSLIGLDQLILPSAAVNSNGKVSTANPKTTDVLLSAARIDEIMKADRIRMKAYFNTPFDANGTTQQDVKFYKDYNVLLQLGVQAEILAEIKQ